MENYIILIESLWQIRSTFKASESNLKEAQQVVAEVLSLLNSGQIKVCEKKDGLWVTNEWIKKAILLHFIINDAQLYSTSSVNWYDKIPPKFLNYDETMFRSQASRIVPGAFVRYGAYISRNVVLMPSFVNVGAYVDEGTMVDTWATIGSCAYIGKNCHISGGVGIGGVLEPLQARPVIIEDNCFIGARSEIAEGVIVEEGAVISMGVFIGASTKIVNRHTGEIIIGRVPAYSVVVPGSLPSPKPGLPGLYCAVIIKTVDEKTRAKTGINELLRD